MENSKRQKYTGQPNIPKHKRRAHFHDDWIFSEIRDKWTTEVR